MSREEEAEELIKKLESMEQDMKNGLQQIDDDLQGMENDEKAVKNYEDHLDSLNAEQLKEMEHELEVTTEEGQRTLEDLKELLGMEENSIKTLAQVTHLLDRTTEDVGDKEEDIDRMLENLKQQAENGNVDEELAARCVAEILEAREEIMENAEIEEVAGSEAEQLGAELGKAHQDLVEMKRDEVNLRDELEEAETWAGQHQLDQMKSFVEQEEAPDLRKEIQELQREVRRQTGDEDQFLQTMTKLAEEGQLTEQQIDHLITQQQEWSTVMQQVMKDGSSGVKKLGEALLGWTPKGIAMGLARGGMSEGLDRVDTDKVMNTVKNIDEKVIGGAEEAEKEAETAVKETQDAKDRVEQAKAD